MLCYAKKKRENSKDKTGFKRNLIPRDNTDAYSNPDNDPKGPWKADPITAHNVYDANYTITKPNGIVIHRPNDRYWVYSKSTLDEKIKHNEIIWGSGDSIPMAKRYLKDVQDGLVPITLFSRKFAGDSSQAKKNLDSLFPESKGMFSYSKPVQLIKRIIQIGSKPNSIILDCFAGTGTTAQAVMEQNIEDHGTRKFIMVQIPEKTFSINSGVKTPTDSGRVAFESGYESIDEISRERIKRAAAKLNNDEVLAISPSFDGSFKHYRVVQPSYTSLEEINSFDSNTTSLFTNVLNSFSSEALHLPGEVTGEQTILTTWLAKDGFGFNAKVNKKIIGEYTAYQVENQLYLISEGWSSESTKSLINQLGKHELDVQVVVLFGYSFNIAELRELENGLKQLDSSVSLIKRY